MIARLSDLLRYTLEESDTQEVSLRQEMGFIRDYLEIQEIRFQGRLDVREEIDPDVQDALLPGLILQPLVENAIKHGVERVSGRGIIRIVAQRRQDRLEVTVLDNGPGPAADAEIRPARSGNGLGLTNTRERLQGLYGSEQSLTLSSREEGGFRATLSIPYHTTSDLKTSAVNE